MIRILKKFNLKLKFFIIFLISVLIIQCGNFITKEQAAENYRNCLLSLIVLSNNNQNNFVPINIYCGLIYREERIKSGE